MSRRPSNIKLADMDRILKAAKRAGVEVRVQIHPDGTIEFETRRMADSPSNQDDPEGISELIKNAS